MVNHSDRHQSLMANQAPFAVPVMMVVKMVVVMVAVSGEFAFFGVGFGGTGGSGTGTGFGGGEMAFLVALGQAAVVVWGGPARGPALA